MLHSKFWLYIHGLCNVFFFLDSDGAAAIVLMSGEKALQLGLQVIARVSGYADAAQVLLNKIPSFSTTYAY